MKKIIILSAALLSYPLIAFANSEVDNSVVEAGKVHEVCMKLEDGQKMEYSFKSAMELNFNIHYHDGDNVSYPVEEHLTKSDNNIFTSPGKRGYCMMWTNPNEEASELKVEYEIIH